MLKNAADQKTNPYWKEHADNLDAFVYMVLVDADVANNDMRDFLYRDRTQSAGLCQGDVRPGPAQAATDRTSST